MGGAQELDFADGRAEIAAAGRWMDQAVRADSATVDIAGMAPLVFDTRRHRRQLAEFRDRCAGMADANGKPFGDGERTPRFGVAGTRASRPALILAGATEVRRGR